MKRVTIEAFQCIDQKVKEKWGRHFYKYVDFCGLEPVLQNARYDSTPANSITFAATRGDGVHFGYFTKSNPDVQPIVMTVPMVSKNIILAETFDEFLGIGFYNGWDSLEQLAYDFNETIRYYSGKDDSLTAQRKAFLEFLRLELNMTPYQLTELRLKDLAERYHELAS